MASSDTDTLTSATSTPSLSTSSSTTSSTDSSELVDQSAEDGRSRALGPSSNVKRQLHQLHVLSRASLKLAAALLSEAALLRALAELVLNLLYNYFSLPPKGSLSRSSLKRKAAQLAQLTSACPGGLRRKQRIVLSDLKLFQRLLHFILPQIEEK